MKKKFFLVLGVATLLVLQACGGRIEEATATSNQGAAADTQSGVPKIVAADAAYDFGKVKSGEDVEHVWKIRNEGTADLFLLSAKGS